MELYSRIFEAQCNATVAKDDLVIIHGLFGMSDNWVSIAKQFSLERRVIVPDLRNHGKSPHSDAFSIPIMVDDIEKLLLKNNSSAPIILGHSLGGTVAMHFALTHAKSISKLIVADMSLRPLQLQKDHWAVFELMKNIPLEQLNSLKEIEDYLSKKNLTKKLALLILKNIKRNKQVYEWKLNLHVLINSFEQKKLQPKETSVYKNPSLFLKAVNSAYILPEDYPLIYQHFPASFIRTINEAGHWLHVDQKEEFIKVVTEFMHK